MLVVALVVAQLPLLIMQPYKKVSLRDQVPGGRVRWKSITDGTWSRVRVLILSLFCLSVTIMANADMLDLMQVDPIVSETHVLLLQNEICPIMNRQNKRKRKVEFEGVQYTLCCKPCLRKFKANPEDYSLSKDVIHTLRTQSSKTSLQ
ncbi:MAG: YHS domain-containing protein [Candidatus Omnitrophota bacterium]|jgi:YHS domain-containing protein